MNKRVCTQVEKFPGRNQELGFPIKLWYRLQMTLIARLEYMYLHWVDVNLYNCDSM